MPRATATRALLLLAMAGVLGLLVGLVRSGERPVSPPRPSNSVERSWPEPAGVVLSAPVVLPPLDGAAPPPAQASEPARPSDSRRAPPRLTGFVFRPDGAPASEARVLLGQQQAHCSAEGRFELMLPPDAAGADLLAFESGYEPVVRPHFGAGLAPGVASEVRLVLGPETRSLAGTVIARDGRPLKGWSVELEGPDPLADSGLRERVRTDVDGGFVLPDVPAGIHVVRAWKERPQLAVRSDPIAAGESGLTIVVDADE